MSTYYYYYLGVKDDDGKISLVGPYDKDKTIIAACSYSYSWYGHIFDEAPLDVNYMSDSFKQAFAERCSLTDLSIDEQIKHSGHYGYIDYEDFVGDYKSASKFVFSGYYENEWLNSYLALNEEERSDRIFEEGLFCLTAEQFALKCKNNPDEIKNYSFYAIFNPYHADFIRYKFYMAIQPLLDYDTDESKLVVIQRVC